MSIVRNTAINFLGSVIPIAILIITVPIYLNLIGTERYGVLALVWLIIGYFGLFDLGLGRATAQRIASLRSGKKQDQATAYWTAMVLNIFLGLIAALIMLPTLNFFIDNTLDNKSGIAHEVVTVLPWLALMMPLATVSGVLTGVLTGRERFGVLNLVSTIGFVVIQALPILTILIWGPELRVIIPSVFIARLLTMVVLFGLCQIEIGRGSRFAFDLVEAKLLFKFGGWVTVSAIVGPMMVIFDRLVIGAISGASAVTLYTIPFQLAERSTMLPRAVATTVFPRMSGQDQAEQNELAKKGQAGLITLMTPFTIIGIIGAEPFLSIWIGAEFAENAATLTIILLAGFWVNCLAAIPYSLLQAKGRPDLVAKCHMLEVVPYLLLLYVGLSFFGLVGAALAFSIRAAADAAILCVLSDQVWNTLRKIMIPVPLLLLAILVAQTLAPFSSPWLFGSIVIISFALIQAYLIGKSLFGEKLRRLKSPSHA